MTVFAAKLQRHYLQQCANIPQLLKAISHMGLFGNISETLHNLSNAIEGVFDNPYHEDNFLKGIVYGGAIFIKRGLGAVSTPFISIFSTLRNGFTVLIDSSRQGEEPKQIDNDIEQFSKDVNNFGTTFNIIDSQNRIWLKILTKE